VVGKTWNYQIKISNPDQKDRVMTFNDGEYTLGRVEDCDILIKEALISRRHAQLELHEGVISLMDLGSANGTQVNGIPLLPRQRVTIEIEQIISLGSYTIQIQSEAGVQTNYKLVWRQAEGTWQETILNSPSLIIGRGQAANLCLDSQTVSQQHAIVSLDQNRVYLLDPGSRNGVVKNGERIALNQKIPVLVGESFLIEDFIFELQGNGETITSEKSSPAPELSKPAAMGTLFMGGVEIGVEWRNFPLKFGDQDDRIVIGRDPENAVVLEHPTVSRYHAVIERMGTRFRVTDLHSANGVYINGQAIDTPELIKPNDKIKIGPYEFLFTGVELRGTADAGVTIEAVKLNKQVNPKTNLLQDISLSIGADEFVAIVGTSGAGKTTLLDALNGFRRATSGQVLVNGVDFYRNYDMFRNDIGYVPQKDIVHLELTPEQALDYAAQLRMPPDTTSVERKAAVDETLTELGLSERRSLPISHLSGGQLKRVSIGVELLTKPRLFFLDEPTSGLDPGTEYDMMKLLRRLADQGRTIFIVTHATKNVILCDKVIIMARGGYVAFFGPPEDALVYFDQFRLDRERLEKKIEFDDVYRILNDLDRGSPADWSQRFLNYRTQKEPPMKQPTDLPSSAPKQKKKRQVSALRQFQILSARNLKIIFQDKVTLGLMLALAPLLGLMNFIWGDDLFDPVTGKAAKILVVWFMSAIIAILVGSLSSVREIVKEADIYKRERAVNLQIFPYILSKLWVGVVLAIYQGSVMLFFIVLLTRPIVPGAIGYVSLLITMILGILAGYMTGLVVSAGVPNQNAALIVVIAVLVPQFMFTGVLLPLKQIPGGEVISIIIPARWTFEGFVRATKMGEALASDPCWKLPEDQRNILTDAEKDQCTCMGSHLFERCTGIPGLYSKSFYDEKAKTALAQEVPQKPVEPTGLPTLTPHPTLTPLPTVTPLATFTPIPALGVGPYSDLPSYMAASQEQMRTYYDQRSQQENEYSNLAKDQLEIYLDQQKQQGEALANDSKSQFSAYADEMEIYGEQKSAWEKDRQKAISGAEVMLKLIIDDFRPSLEGSIVNRWGFLTGLNVVMLLMIVFFQKRKDAQ